MISTTIGKLLIDEALPPEMRHKVQDLDKSGTQKLFQELADKYPDKYREISQKLMQVGAEAGFMSGGYSFGLKDLLPSKAAMVHKQNLKKDIEKILLNPNLPQEEKEKAIILATDKYREPIEKAVFEEAKANSNPLAKQVISGAKGSPANLRSLLGTDLLYVDHKDEHVPIPIMHSYAEGLTPAEYFASTFGVRKGVVDLKAGTAQAGYTSKQLTAAAHRLLVTAHDTDKPENPDRPLGMPSPIDDADNEGATLAVKTGPYPRNTVLTPKIIADLKNRKHKDLLVRSPIVGGPPDGGLYSMDLGLRERGGFNPIGDEVGVTAAAAISEPLQQGVISCLAKGTLVRMEDWSTKKIEDIEPGDMVIGSDMQGNLSPVRVNYKFDNGVQECYRTVFRSGRASKQLMEVISTLEHKILTTNGLRPIGDAMATHPILHHTFDDTGYASEPTALMLGLLLGDGCYTKSLGDAAFLSCADPLLIQDTKEYLEDLNLKLVKYPAGAGLMHRFSQIHQIPSKRNSLGQVVAGYRNPARQKLAEYGMMHKYAHEKTIPKEAFQWNNSTVANLLAGLFATDGCVCLIKKNKKIFKPHLSFASTSIPMVEQVKALLQWRFGIYSGSISVSSNPEQRKRPLASLHITDSTSIIRFYDSIPLVGVKRRTLSNLMKRWVADCTKGFKPCRISQDLIGPKHVYDLEVDHTDNLFLVASSGMNCIILNSKHLGGVAGAQASAGGFKLIDQLIQHPEVFTGGTPHAQLDGKVESIEKAPQGGQYITIGGQKHYDPYNFKPLVKVGDALEAGDALTEGTVNPAEFVHHKGIGEGRRRFIDAFRRAGKSSGFNFHRRNIEVLARGLIDHVRLAEEIGPYVPDDIIHYSALEHNYKPRHGHEQVRPKNAVGKYLESPALHYTIGTMVKPSVVNELDQHGVNSILVHKDPPPFEPVMVPGRQLLSYDPDWMVRMLGSNQQRNFLRGAHRAEVSDPYGTSYVPSLARGLGFGEKGKVQGFDPKNIVPLK